VTLFVFNLGMHADHSLVDENEITGRLSQPFGERFSAFCHCAPGRLVHGHAIAQPSYPRSTLTRGRTLGPDPGMRPRELWDQG